MALKYLCCTGAYCNKSLMIGNILSVHVRKYPEASMEIYARRCLELFGNHLPWIKCTKVSENTWRLRSGRFTGLSGNVPSSTYFPFVQVCVRVCDCRSFFKTTFPLSLMMFFFATHSYSQQPKRCPTRIHYQGTVLVRRKNICTYLFCYHCVSQWL